MKLTPKIQARARVIAGAACALVCVVFIGASVATGALSLSPYSQSNGESDASALASSQAVEQSTEESGAENALDFESSEADVATDEGVADAQNAESSQAADTDVQSGTSANGGQSVTSTDLGIGGAVSGGVTSGSESAGAASGSGAGFGSAAGSGSSGSPSASNGSGSQASGVAEVIQVSVAIDASAAASAKPDAGYSGISRTATVSLSQGSTARDALIATGANVSGSVTYITGIDGLYEKACSSGSGWMYSVNGSVPMKPASSYVLSAGDVVRWYYVV